MKVGTGMVTSMAKENFSHPTVENTREVGKTVDPLGMAGLSFYLIQSMVTHGNFASENKVHYTDRINIVVRGLMVVAKDVGRYITLMDPVNLVYSQTGT